MEKKFILSFIVAVLVLGIPGNTAWSMQQDDILGGAKQIAKGVIKRAHNIGAINTKAFPEFDPAPTLDNALLKTRFGATRTALGVLALFNLPGNGFIFKSFFFQKDSSNSINLVPMGIVPSQWCDEWTDILKTPLTFGIIIPQIGIGLQELTGGLGDLGHLGVNALISKIRGNTPAKKSK